jgi:hypothetical protein
MNTQEYDTVTDFKKAYMELSKDLQDYLNSQEFKDMVSEEADDEITYRIALLMEKSVRQENRFLDNENDSNV